LQFGSISQNKLTKVKQHLQDHGLSVRKKQSGGRNSNALTKPEQEKIEQFLRGYAEDNALVLPGRMQSFAKDDVMLLPSSHTKHFVYEQYCSAARSSGINNDGK